MPITPATMTPIRTMAAMTISTIFRTVVPEVVGGGGMFGYGGLGGMGAPALIVIPRVFFRSFEGKRLLHGGDEVDRKSLRQYSATSAWNELHHQGVSRAERDLCLKRGRS